MIYVILMILVGISLGINFFVVWRQIRLNKDLIKEIELRAKYEKYLISQYEEVHEEKRKLEWQNERLREQVEFFERELATEEAEKKETTNLHKGESK